MVDFVAIGDVSTGPPSGTLQIASQHADDPCLVIIGCQKETQTADLFQLWTSDGSCVMCADKDGNFYTSTWTVPSSSVDAGTGYIFATTITATNISAATTMFSETITATNISAATNIFAATVTATNIDASAYVKSTTITATTISGVTNVDTTTLKATTVTATNISGVTNVDATTLKSTTTTATSIYTQTVTATNVSGMTNLFAATVTATQIYTDTLTSTNISGVTKIHATTITGTSVSTITLTATNISGVTAIDSVTLKSTTVTGTTGLFVNQTLPVTITTTKATNAVMTVFRSMVITGCPTSTAVTACTIAVPSTAAMTIEVFATALCTAGTYQASAGAYFRNWMVVGDSSDGTNDLLVISDMMVAPRSVVASSNAEWNVNLVTGTAASNNVAITVVSSANTPIVWGLDITTRTISAYGH
uniref:Uncharacterized protein n=1 Tax=viral metagenome TaxID=1070528 RepID=A0A6M3IKT4_9ZZZZ